MGGAVFVQQGGTLTVAGPFSINGNTVNGGLGGGAGGRNGSAFGTGMFMQGTGTLTFAPGSAQGQIISDVIADEKGVIAAGYTPPSAFTAGSWNMTLSGPGSLTLSAANMYTGNTNVLAGTLNVTGSIASSKQTTVGGGAALVGTGTVGALQINSGGTFAPGAIGLPGTAMTVSGNLAFASGAVYLVQLNPSTATSATVSGTATLTGATVSAKFAPGSYMQRQYDILRTSGGLNGTTFASAASSLPGLAVSLSYSGTDVFLNLNAGLSAISGLTINERNVATTLDNYFNSGGALPPAFASLFGLTGSAQANALMHLDGEVATGSEVPAFQLMDEFLNLMLDPFVDGRLGSGAGYGGAAAIGFAPDAQTILPPDVAMAYAGVLKAPPAPAFHQRWTTWAASYGGANTTAGDPAVVGSSNLTAQTFGFAAGMDYHFSPDTIVGFALGGGGTGWGLADGMGTGRSDAFQTGVYAITRSGPAYLGASVAFANHWMTTNRATMGDILNANFDAQSYGGRIEGGYRFAVLPTLGVSPYAAVQAQAFHTPAYSETDVTGGGLGLNYAAMNATDTRTELGTRFDDPAVIGGIPVLLRGRVAWAHDFVSNPALSAAFETLPGTNFIVNGAAIPHDSALTLAGAELFFTPRWSLLVKFDGDFAPTSQTYAGSGTLRYSW
jgi:autotransporter-associated beta strand protein